MHRHENNGRLPISTLKNLIPEVEPNLNSRHVTIAISGWLSQEGDKTAEW